MRVLFASVTRLAPAGQLTLKNDIYRLITGFVLPPELISKAVDIATVISQFEAGENNLKQYQKNIDGWAVEIIQVKNIFRTKIVGKSNSSKIAYLGKNIWNNNLWKYKLVKN